METEKVKQKFREEQTKFKFNLGKYKIPRKENGAIDDVRQEDFLSEINLMLKHNQYTEQTTSIAQDYFEEQIEKRTQGVIEFYETHKSEPDKIWSEAQGIHFIDLEKIANHFNLK